ncbi:MAG: Hpt domain-containing protein [Ktedonobacterales bacterium]|jgi:chemotaxis protein histidine kinase CheA/ActR/RegA family two-component response regulator
MADNFDKSAILGSFLDEVDAYIPEIEAHLDQLQQTPDDETAIEEAYRHTHTIYGSAAMMEFTGLAQIAKSMEATLDDALERRAALDQATIALLRRSCGRLARVAQLIRSGGDDKQIVAEDTQDQEAYRGSASAAAPTPPSIAPMGAGAPPWDASAANGRGPSSPLPDWLAAFGPNGAPSGDSQPGAMPGMAQSMPGVAPSAGAWAPSVSDLPTGATPIVTPQQQAAFGQSSAGAPQRAGQMGMLGGGQPTDAALAARDWASSMSTQPPQPPRPAPGGATAALEELRGDSDDVQRQVMALRNTVAMLRDAAQAMDNERVELQSFLDGSHDAVDRLEEWVGQQMGLDLRRSPETVRGYLPLSVIWVTTTRLKKLIALLNTSGRNLTLSQEQIDETLRQFRATLDTLAGLTSSFGVVNPSANGGFSATVAQVTWSPSSPSASLPAVDALAPGQRAEMERGVREDLRRSLEDEVRQEIAAEVRRDEEQRIRQELEVQIRRQMMFSALGPGMGDSSVSVAGGGVEVRPQSRAARQVRVTNEQSPETLEVFREEAQEHLQTITSGIADLERSPGDMNSIQTVRRAMHTLKGAAGMMGFVPVQSLAHASEDLLDQLAEHGRPLSPDELSLVFDTAETLDRLITGSLTIQQQREAAQALIDRYATLTGTPPMVNLLDTGPEEQTAETVAIDLGGDPDDAATIRGKEDLSVRVKLSKLDELVTLFGDLLVNRSIFEERIGRIYQLVGDSTQASERLREVGSQLETQFETFMLPSGQSGLQAPGAAPAGGGFRFPWSSQRPTGGQGTNGANLPGHLSEFHELEMDRYTEFHRLSKILSEAVTDVLTLDHEMESLIREIQMSFARETRISSEVQDRLLKLRLVPVSSLVPRLYRATRASALKEGKEVEFFVEGGDTEVDRKVIEEVEGPLLHLVRNAVNHGIERPDQREARGKPRAGRITLAAAYEGNQVVIDVRDDGAGIDPQRVRQTAITKGWIDGYANLSDHEALNLIFQPGVSTAETLTEEAGRGVGLDVVRDAAARLKGSVDVDSTVGSGSVFTLKFPISLQIARAVLVKAGNHTYAIPMAVVDQIGRLDYYERVSDPTPAVMVRSERYALARLSTYLNAPAAPLDERSSLLILNAGRRKVALVVDGIVSQQEIVAKPLGAHLRDVRGVAGATALGNGQVVIILDLLELLAHPIAETLTLPVPGQRTVAPSPFSRIPSGALSSRPAAAPSTPFVAPVDAPITPPFPFGGPSAPSAPFSGPGMEASASSSQWGFPVGSGAPSLDAVPTSALPNAPLTPPPWAAPPSPPTASGLPTASTLGQRDFVVASRAMTDSGRLDAPESARESYLLVVDDSPSVRRVVGGMLKAHGWETQTARDGVEALDVIARQRPSAVLLDIEMPRMDGYELMATLRSDPQYRNLPLIVLTSRAAARHQQRATQLGANAYIVKPYQDEFLLSTIGDLVRRSQSGAL